MGPSPDCFAPEFFAERPACTRNSPMPGPLLAALARLDRTPILERVLAAVIFAGLYAAAWVVVDRYLDFHPSGLRVEVYAALGLVLSMLLVFRTNTAYDRWWEARKIWGGLVNDSRNLALKLKALLGADDPEARAIRQSLPEFAEALRDHLRRQTSRGGATVLKRAATEPTTSVHQPMAIAARIQRRLADLLRSGRIDSATLLTLDRHAAALMDACGACERIRRTPIPGSYVWFIRQCVALYLLALPPSLVAVAGWWTVLAELTASWFMVGVEMIAEDIEEPFGESPDDLRLEEYCDTIRESVAELERSADR
jgi:putative membrane protein